MLTPTARISPLEHGLGPHLEALAAFETTRDCEASALFNDLRGEIGAVLDGVEVVSSLRNARGPGAGDLRAAAWNIERGIALDGIIDACLVEPRLGAADVLFLTEIDYGMARTGNRHVAREIAARLDLNYAFAPCYLALTKGAGMEAEADGENTWSLHGNALMSPFPLENVHTLRLPNGKDKMTGHEKRLGSQRAIIADVRHPEGVLRAVAVHLDAHSSQKHRHHQMKLVLDHLDSLPTAPPVLIGGDWNTTTHDASRALYSILGYARRVLMGVGRVLREHYPHPDRWFERRLFGELASRGYDYRSLNVAGGCTLHYSIRDLAANRNMAEWIPAWCFWFIDRALEGAGGRCSMKLDWFAGRDIHVEPARPGQGPSILEDVGRGTVLSDHEPIALGFRLGGGVPR